MIDFPSVQVLPLHVGHWPQVRHIYAAGIATGHATFEPEPPSWAAFNASKLPAQRLVAVDSSGAVVGWAAASAVSNRSVYAGVVEHSVYVDSAVQSRGIGPALLAGLSTSTEAAGIWTIQAGIFPENTASLRLHERAGFRIVGTRQRVGKMTYGSLAGRWRDVIMIEHRSSITGRDKLLFRLPAVDWAPKKGAHMTSQVDYDFSLAHKVAVVTGGASGIGAAIVHAYAAKGASVVVLDKAVQSAEREVTEGHAAAAVECDVTIEQSVNDAIAHVKAEFGRIDVLVNSAGVAVTGAAEELTVDDWDITMGVNLRGAFLVSQHVGRVMLAQGSGTVISLASQAATVALPGHLAYCASKCGLVGMTKVLALEWAGRGVTANTISPTVVMTPLAKEVWDNPEGEALKAQIPTQRFAEPEEIAAVAVFLASDAAKMINGVDLLVDGGYTIR